MMDVTHAGGVIVRGTSPVEFLIATSSTGVGWVLPKGMIDPGETPEEAALREVCEEVAVECEIVALLGDFDIDKLYETVRTRYFLMRVLRHTRRTEERDTLWTDLETAKEMVNSDGAREALDRADAELRSRAAP